MTVYEEASREELTTIDGVGEQTANRIRERLDGANDQ